MFLIDFKFREVILIFFRLISILFIRGFEKYQTCDVYYFLNTIRIDLFVFEYISTECVLIWGTVAHFFTPKKKSKMVIFCRIWFAEKITRFYSP